MSQQFEIAKLDADQCLVFGFANVSITKSGSLLEDTQEDAITPSELEKMAYDFVLDFREADDMHEGPATGRLVESFVFTPEKLEKLATDPATGVVDTAALQCFQRCLPARWWVGFKMEKDSFAKVKSGEYKMFSIAGEAKRIPV